MLDSDISILAPFLSGKGGTETVLNKVIDRHLPFKIILTQGTANKGWLKNRKSSFIDFGSANKIISIIKTIKYLRSIEKETLLVCLSSKLLALAILVRKFYNKKYKVVSWIHFSIFDEETVKPALLNYADYHLAISSGIKRQLESLGISNSKIYTVYNPVSEKNDSKKISNNPFKLIYIGRIEMEKQKNLAELISFLSHEKFDYTLDIYGSGEEDQLKKVVKKYSMQNRVSFFGWVEDPWEMISDASAIVLNSNYEGFPMVLLEAISYGLPAISADCPTGPNDIIKNGINGYLFEPGNIQSFHNALKLVMNSKFDSRVVKNSIDFCYDDAYFNRLSCALDEIMKVNEEMKTKGECKN